MIGIDYKQEQPYLSNLIIKKGEYNSAKKNGVLIWEEYADVLGQDCQDSIILFLKNARKKTITCRFEISGILSHRKSAGLEDKGEMLITPVIFADYSFLAQKLGINDVPTDISFQDIQKIDIVKKKALSEGLQFFYSERGFNAIHGIIEFLQTIGAFISGFILIILIVSTINIQMMGYLERRGEIGTILAMGVSPPWIVMMFFLEMIIFASVVFFVSICLYVLFAFLFNHGIGFGEYSVIFAQHRFIPQFIPESAFWSYGAILAALFLSSLYPAYLAAKVNPALILSGSQR